MSSLSNQGNLKIIVAIVIGLLILVGIPLFIVDRFSDESRDYKLYDEMHVLAQELKEYKKQNGHYPESILTIRKSENLCVFFIYPKCQKVYYKPSADLQDFKMAMHSFSWPILYYHPQVSMTTDEVTKIPVDEQDQIIKSYGAICFFCMAYPEGEEVSQEFETSIPVYRKTPPIFGSPDEWPEI